MLVSTRNQAETADGYLGPLYQNGTDIYFTDKLLLNAKKFVIGLWLGTTSLTFALIIHVGRCSKKAANAINKVLFDVMQITEKVVTIPKKFAQFTKTATKKEAAEETSKETLVTNEKQTSEKSGIIVQMETLVNNAEDDNKSDQEQASEQERIPFITDEQKTIKQINHVFAHFAEQIQRISTTSIILVLFFLGFNIYALVINGKLSYDWIILSPFPFWFLLVLVTNLIAFPITQTILLHRKLKRKQSPDHNRQLHKPIIKKMFKCFTDFIVVISSTTLPVFVIFHFFWLAVAFSTLTIRTTYVLIFYIPMITFIIWFSVITSSTLRRWKELINRELNNGSKVTWKRVEEFFKYFLYPLIPFLFLPFWVLFLGTLFFFSNCLLNTVKIDNLNIIITFGVSITVIGTTVKIAQHCQPKLDHIE